jgi:putative inorganic carbon (hco3(-)) transporter
MIQVKPNNSSSVAGWLRENFYTRRFNSLPGWITIALVGILLGFLGNTVDQKIPLFIVAGVAGILFILISFKYPEVVYYTFIFSILIFTLPTRLFGIQIPLGMAIEPVGYLCIFTTINQQYKKKTETNAFWKNPISIMMIVLFIFFLLEAINPEKRQMGGWFSYVRKQLLYILFYYCTYLVMDSYKKIKRFFKCWIVIALIVAFWALKQQFLGFTAFEDAWIHSDPVITELLFQAGMFRKFSLLPDPASFGVMSASSALFTLVLAIRISNKKKKYFLLAATAIQLIASSYSGTRTSNVIFFAGLLAYIIFTLNEVRTIRVLIGAAFVTLFLLFGPFQNNPIIYRMSTTFDKKDPSAMVREINRKNIQPYIYRHPIGGGLNTCGEEGKVYYPGHVLAGYPPDSGYMKIMLEQGWIGLALNIVFYFIILQRGAWGFYNSRNPEIKTLYITLTVCLFSLMVGQYSQLAISQYPQILFYFASLVILYKLKDFDTPPNKETNEITTA